MTGEYVRQVSGGYGILALVGGVHEHPTSIYRVRHVIKGIDHLDSLAE